MAEYTYRRTVSTHHEWSLTTTEPYGTNPAEIAKAIAAARQKYIEIHGADPTFDDWCRIFGTGDGIVIRLVEDAGSGG